MKTIVRKMFLTWFICVVSLICLPCYAQTTIQMEADGGVYRIPCTINGLRLKMIFDPGASSVCISEPVAKMMLDNDYLSVNDIKGNSQSQVADGRIVDHTIINLKKVQIGDKVLTNVEAVVIHGQDAPLLFGQSALKRLGGYTISGNKLTIGETNPSAQTGGSVLNEENVNRILAEARNAKSNRLYRVAIEKYKELYDYGMLETLDIFSYAYCFYFTDEYKTALELLQSIQHTIETEYPDDKVRLYSLMGECYMKNGDYNTALLNYEKCKYYEEPYRFGQVNAVISIASIYQKQGNYYKSQKELDDYISDYLYHKELNATDCWSYSAKPTLEEKELLGLLYYYRAISYESYNNDVEKFMLIAAAWGNERAIEWCNKYDVYFRTKPFKYKY